MSVRFRSVIPSSLSNNPAGSVLSALLELMKPRRIASVQLLGSVQEGVFNPGITILPTLDAPAEIGAPNVLKAVFESPPRRNKPEDYEGDDFDCDLRIGSPTGRKVSLRGGPSSRGSVIA